MRVYLGAPANALREHSSRVAMVGKARTTVAELPWLSLLDPEKVEAVAQPGTSL
jgi:hypothetical protein